jgi:ketosteroid isomerase-like protein
MASSSNTPLETTMEPTHALVKEVQHFLDRFAAAVNASDGEAATHLWETPALVVGDHMTMAVGSDEQVAKMFGSAKDHLKSRGATDTRAEILGLEDLTPRVVLVTAHFDWLDGDGEQVGGETTTFTLRRDRDGAFRVKTSVMHGAETH